MALLKITTAPKRKMHTCRALLSCRFVLKKTLMISRTNSEA